MSREKVKRYFEVRFFSLVLMAIGIFVVCMFLLFFFVLHGQYIYAVAALALAVIVLLAAVELLRYAKILKKCEMATAVQKTQNGAFYIALKLFAKLCRKQFFLKSLLETSSSCCNRGAEKE